MKNVLDKILKNAKPLDWNMLHNDGYASLLKMSKSKNREEREAGKRFIKGITISEARYITLAGEAFGRALRETGHASFKMQGVDYIFNLDGEYYDGSIQSIQDFLFEYCEKIGMPEKVMKLAKIKSEIYKKAFPPKDPPRAIARKILAIES